MRFCIKYKNEIQGVKDVSETVKTVEKIAASSIHFLKEKVFNLNQYVIKIEKILDELSLFHKDKNNILLQKRKAGKKAIIILTSDKGLVGGLWHNIINHFLKNSKEYKYIIMVGIKGENYLKEEKLSIIKLFDNSFEEIQKEEIQDIIDYVFTQFSNGVFSQVDILYPKFISLPKQEADFIQFLPFQFEMKDKKIPKGIPIFEPSKKKIFDQILKKYIKTSFQKIILEAKLSELSSRTVAMEHASTQTEELVKKLTLDYTKQRRRIITKRQLESFTTHKTI